ncbi:MAG: aspartate/glutamate racemase family protein [Promethearchaeota archaeon]|nr:MAG: aspartate/glutamate racemase family protein [Candidatus Lokiarchaeota archaeon]
MKVIGLLGGMSWESSLEYYRIINEKVKQRMGGLNSAKCILYSVNFQEIETLQHEGKWEHLTKIMIESALNLERAGAEMILICTNTMHKMADEVQNSIQVPLIHIADTAAEKVKEKNLKKVGLLGTKYTMEQEFYKGRIKERYNIDVLIPDSNEREIVHDIIFNELCLGKIKSESKEQYKKIIQHLIQKGAEGIILGCTEIPLLINQEDFDIPIFDTTMIHCEAAIDYALT